MSFATLCRQVREEKRLTQKEMARNLGVHPVQISVWETGRTKNPVRNTLMKFAKVFNLDRSVVLASVTSFKRGRPPKDRQVENKMVVVPPDRSLVHSRKQRMAVTIAAKGDFFLPNVKQFPMSQLSPEQMMQIAEHAAACMHALNEETRRRAGVLTRLMIAVKAIPRLEVHSMELDSPESASNGALTSGA